MFIKHNNFNIDFIIVEAYCVIKGKTVMARTDVDQFLMQLNEVLELPNGTAPPVGQPAIGPAEGLQIDDGFIEGSAKRLATVEAELREFGTVILKGASSGEEDELKAHIDKTKSPLPTEKKGISTEELEKLYFASIYGEVKKQFATEVGRTIRGNASIHRALTIDLNDDLNGPPDIARAKCEFVQELIDGYGLRPRPDLMVKYSGDINNMFYPMGPIKIGGRDLFLVHRYYRQKHALLHVPQEVKDFKGESLYLTYQPDEEAKEGSFPDTYVHWHEYILINPSITDPEQAIYLPVGKKRVPEDFPEFIKKQILNLPARYSQS